MVLKFFKWCKKIKENKLIGNSHNENELITIRNVFTIRNVSNMGWVGSACPVHYTPAATTQHLDGML